MRETDGEKEEIRKLTGKQIPSICNSCFTIWKEMLSQLNNDMRKPPKLSIRFHRSLIL